MPVEAKQLLAGAALGTAALVTLDYLVHKRSIPGPPEVPLLGNTLAVHQNYDDFVEWLVRMTDKYGPTWTFRIIGQPRFVVITDPANVEHVLKTRFDNYPKGPGWQERFQEVLGAGIFNADGEAWRVQRKTASHMFSQGSFKTNMLHVFVKHGHKLQDMLLGAKSGEAIDIANVFFRFTLDSIGEIAFGKDIGSLHQDIPFANAFDGAQYSVQLRFLTLFWKMQKFTPRERKLAENIQTLNSFCTELIKERRAEGKNSGRSDLLSLFLESGDDVDDEFLRDVIINYTIAGRDTTAQALAWAVYMLNKHPEVERKVIAEIDEVIGQNEVVFEHTKKLPYLHAVFSEVVRLWPSVPKDSKYALADDVLPDGTQIKAGDWVLYVPYVMGRRTELWGPDAREFKPERWLAAGFKPSPFKFISFNAGPRTCLGQHMAFLEAKVALAMIYQKVRLRLVPGHPVIPENSLTLPTRHGIKVTIEPRQAQ